MKAVKIKDLVLSLAYDDGKLMLSVAVHKCKSHQYDGIIQIKSVQIGEYAMDKMVYQVLDQAADHFKKELKPINITKAE